MKKILMLLLPRLWGTAVYQTSVFVDTILASFYWIVGNGGQSALYYSSRLFQLPLAIFGVSFAQAALPTLSTHYAKEEMDAFKSAMLFSLRQVIFMTLPAALGLAVFSDIIVKILFERGAFTAYSTQVTSEALFYYSIGLLSCAFIKVLVSAFYALQDTRTPVKTAFFGLLANIVLNLALMWHLKIGGLALATSLAATLNAVLLYVLISKRIGSLDTRTFAITAFQCGAASGIMSLIGWIFLRPWIFESVLNEETGSAVLKLLASIVMSALIYYVACLVLGSREARDLRRLFSKIKSNVP